MITITDTSLENILKSLLQRNVSFYIKKKPWRNGRLLLFKQNGFYLEFTIKGDKKKNESFEIPIPFEISQEPGKVKFSYKLSSLVCNNIKLLEDIKSLAPNCRSKYFDEILEIHINETG